MAILLGCSSELRPPFEGAAVRAAIELSEQHAVFGLTTTLAEQRSPEARAKEVVARASGALLGPFKATDESPARASNGALLRGSCGVTFVSPSYAITAAHCVDSETMLSQAVMVEMYRPTPALNEGFRAATSLTGVFPDWTHAPLGEAQGYFVDRYPCTLVARCAGAYGGAFQCDAEASAFADVALVRCEGAPGERYGFVELASVDDPEAEVFMPWPHEVYDVPLAPDDELYQHYVLYSGDPANNYHYFGSDAAGREANQLLPLLSVDFEDGSPHHKLTASVNSVGTDLWGCHGSSGAGVFQRGVDGQWELLGPARSGNPEHDRFLCNHLPSLDGSFRGPGGLGLTYEALTSTQLLWRETEALLHQDCAGFLASSGNWFSERTCLNAALATGMASPDIAQLLTAPSAVSPWSYQAPAVLQLEPTVPVELGVFETSAGEQYRLGFEVQLQDGCEGDCPEISVNIGGPLFSTRLVGAASTRPVPMAFGFLAQQTGQLLLELSATGPVEVGGLALVREARRISFDLAHERWQAVLFDLETQAPAPMRFVGDGRAGFEALLFPGERLVMTRQAIASGRRWSLAFDASESAALRCGLLDEDGAVALAIECSAGTATLDDSGSALARSAFFIEALATSPAVRLDDLDWVSDAAPDFDGDALPDLVDPCPRGPLPLEGELTVTVAELEPVRTCRPEPARVSLQQPTVSNACETATNVAQIVSIRGRTLEAPEEVDVPAEFLLPEGNHLIRWQTRDAQGTVYATRDQEVSVAHMVDPSCCAEVGPSIEGSPAADTVIRTNAPAICLLAGTGDDAVIASDASDLLWGDDGDDYLQAREGSDLVMGGPGDDYLGAGTGRDVSLYGGPGNDTLHATEAQGAFISGGTGADVIIASDGPDRIEPGPGTLLVAAGAGDDTVTLFDPCEVHPGLRLVGGPGNDTLVSPVPVDTLRELGALVEGFEWVTLDDTRRHLSLCFAPGAP